MSTFYYASTHPNWRGIDATEVTSGAKSFNSQGQQDLERREPPNGSRDHKLENVGSRWTRFGRILGEVALAAALAIPAAFLIANAPEGPISPDYQNERFEPLHPGMNPSGIQMDTDRMDPYQPVR